MKTHLIIKLKKIGFAIASLLFILACQNEDKDLQDPKFSKTGEIFTDTPIGMGTNFYFPYGPGPDNPIGSKLNAWTVDQNVSYKGNASMRFDVPSENDTEGNYAGGIFRIDGVGRDLSGYDALTFWAKASQGVTIAEFGFGEDFYPNKYITTVKNGQTPEYIFDTLALLSASFLGLTTIEKIWGKRNNSSDESTKTK